MATLDDLVDVLKRIADKVDLLTAASAEDVKLARRASEEQLVQSIMDRKGVDEATARGIIQSWKT